MPEMKLNQEIVRDQLQALARLIKDHVPPGWGFGLMMFEHGKAGNLQWVSDSERSGMVKALREMADKLEAGQAGQPGVDDPASHI